MREEDRIYGSVRVHNPGMISFSVENSEDMSVDEYMSSGWKDFPDGRDWLNPELHELYDEIMSELPCSEVIRNSLREAFRRGHAAGYGLGYDTAANDAWEANRISSEGVS